MLFVCRKLDFSNSVLKGLFGLSNVQLGSVRKIMEVSCKCFQRHVANSFISQLAPSLFDKGNSGWFRNLGNKTQAINCLFGSQGGS